MVIWIKKNDEAQSWWTAPFFWSSMRVDGFFWSAGQQKSSPTCWQALEISWRRLCECPSEDCRGIWKNRCETWHFDRRLSVIPPSHFLVDKLTQGRWRQDEFVVVSLPKKQNISKFGACSHILWHSHYVVVSFLKVKVCCWVFFSLSPKAPKENWRKNRGACQHSGDSETLWLTSTFFPLPGVGQHSHRVLPVFVFEHQHSWAPSSRASATDQCLPYGHACSVRVLWGFYANETT